MNTSSFFKLILLFIVLGLTPSSMLSQVSINQTGCSSITALDIHNIEVELKSYTLEELKSDGNWASRQKKHTRLGSSEFNELPNGIYRVKVVSTQSSNKNILVSDSIKIYGCNHNILKEVSVWPNPTMGTVEISIISKSKLEMPVKATIYNSFGAKIEEWKIFDTHSRFSMAHLPFGLYFISIQDNTHLLAYRKIVLTN